MNESQIKELIEKSLAGTATSEELQVLEKWYDSFEHNPGLTEQLTDQQKDQTADRLLGTIHRSLGSETVSPPRRSTTVLKMRPLAMAASIAAIALLGWWGYNNLGKKDTTPEIKAENIVLKGTGGKATQYQLPDSSLVWLNDGATVSYNASFANEMREIWMEGEAFYSVVSMNGKPFVVHAGNLEITVVGTEFNINMSGADSQTVITVSEGKVSVEANQKQLALLQANDELTFNRSTQNHIRRQSSPELAIAWKTGTLAFKETSFSDIAVTLGKKYGTRVVFRQSAIANCHLTATFDASTSADQMLQLLCKINGFKLEKKDDQYYISGKPCK